MLGALSLPSVSTGFTSDNKSMVPVSIQDMAIKVQNMSPLQSMQEVFFDIRDGIDNLGKVFSDKISGLNKHLAFRLDKLNTTMTTIGKIAAKDLNIEQNTFKEMQENERRDERNEAINRMNQALGEFIIEGPKTTIDFQKAILKSENFKKGIFHTGFLDDFKYP